AARVFISYQHDRIDIAEDIRRRLMDNGADVEILPFLQKVDGNDLIRNVAQAVRAADLIVCVPGRSDSWVSNEVSEAKGALKPILVALPPDHAGIPNSLVTDNPVIDLTNREAALASIVEWTNFVHGPPSYFAKLLKPQQRTIEM